MGTVAAVAKDQRTRYQGVYVRHQRGCPGARGGRCSCRPGFMARVYDRATGKQVRSPTMRSAAAASSWRSATLAKLERGEAPDVRSDVRVGQAVERLVESMREGKALTKHGRRYKPTAIADVESALMRHVVPVLGGRRLGDVRRGDVQRLVDDLALSGSRVRTVVNALRTLYRWAEDRDMVGHNPAALVKLPAMDATPRDRVATPREFAHLLGVLAATKATIADELPYALAGYATARAQEIRRALWADVDLEVGVVYLGADSAGRKNAAALRAVPIVAPLRSALRREWIRQGRPDGSQLLCPPRYPGASGLLATNGVTRRAREAWGWERVERNGRSRWERKRDDALDPILLHESRHTAASWLNAAGVNPKVASQIMGHTTPERAAAAAAGAPVITLSRYTHTLPGDLERAREQLDAWLAAQVAVDEKRSERS